MKKILPFLIIVLIACDNTQSTDSQKEAILTFLQEDAKRVKTDLKIEISELEIKNITVADSIAILENIFNEKIKEEQKTADNFKNSIENADKENKLLDRNNLDDLARISANNSLEGLYEQGLGKAEATLGKLQEQKSSTLKKYENRDNTELLVKEAITTFSFFNPRLQTRQERADTLVLDNDGSIVLGIIQNGKLRRKK